MARQAVIGGVILGVIEGLGIVMTKYGSQQQMMEPPGLQPFQASPPTATGGTMPPPPSFNENFQEEIPMDDDTSFTDGFNDDFNDDFTSSERFT